MTSTVFTWAENSGKQMRTDLRINLRRIDIEIVATRRTRRIAHVHTGKHVRVAHRELQLDNEDVRNRGKRRHCGRVTVRVGYC